MPTILRSIFVSPYTWFLAYLGVFFSINGALIARIDGVVEAYQNPLISHEYTSILHSTLGFIAHITTEGGAVFFNTIFVLLALISLVFYVVQTTPEQKRLPILLVFIALTPLTEILFSWIGKSDPLLIISYVLFIVTKNPVLKNTGILLMILAHKEAALIILVVHLLLFTEERRKWKSYIPGALVGVGFLASVDFFMSNTSARINFVFDNIDQIYRNLLNALPIILTSFSWFWVILLPLLFKQVRARKFELLVAVCIVISVTLLTVDNTRIAALLSLPILFYVIDFYRKERVQFNYKLILLLLVVSLFQAEWAGHTLTLTHWHSFPWEQMEYWFTTYL